MKKLLALLLALAMVLSLAACGAKTETTTADDTAEDTTAAAEEAAETEEAEEAEEPVEEAQTYNIGIIQLIEHPALDAATEGFKDALTDLLGEENVSFDEQNAQGDSANCATIANSLVSEGVDLILANATASLQAAAAATADIPIMGTSITDYATALDMGDSWDGTTGRNISGTADLAPLDGQAEVLNELFPVEEYANVGIVYCSAEANSVYQATVIRGYLEDMGYTVTEYTFADSNDIASVVTNACDASDVLYIPTDNTAANCTETIDSVALPAGVPIIAGEEGICSGCGVATLSISYYDIGYIAGQMAYEVLVNGADISTMEVQYAPNFTKEYDAARCETLGITIPEDYVAIEVDE
jgi:putative ABC transport system substrate-binding protein